VTIARHGKEALLRIEEHVPDLVVTDLVMPEMDGMELLKRIRARWAQLPVILHTPFPDSALMIRALEYSPFTLLSNDCDPARFLCTVQDLTRAARVRTGNEVRTRTRQPAPTVGPPPALSAA
jgi:CheY-like chemotaxis protein